MIVLLGVVAAVLASGLAPDTAWATHCTLEAGSGTGIVNTIDQLTSRPNNALVCNLSNSRSDGTTVFPGFKIGRASCRERV